MQNFWIKATIFWAIISVIPIFYPESIILGFMFFMVPGLIFYLAPTIFCYSLVVTVIGAVFRKKQVDNPYRWAVVSAVGLGVIIAACMNVPIWWKYYSTKNSDIVLTGHFEVPEVIALAELANNEEERYLCQTLCQKLLYNNAVKEVLVGFSANSNFSPTTGVLSYSIKKGGNCPVFGYTATSKYDRTLKNVQERMAAGECLQRTQRTLADTKVIYAEHSGPRNKTITLLKLTSNGYEVIYRRSYLYTDPYVMPLSGGWELPGISLRGLFFVYEKTLNRSENFKEETVEMIFGPSVRESKENSNYSDILNSKLADPSQGSEEISRIMRFYANSYARGVEERPKEDDIFSLQKAIRDLRMKDIDSLRLIIKFVPKENKKALFDAAFDRIISEELTTSGKDIIIQILDALALSATDIGPDAEQKKILNNYPEKRKFISDYFDLRVQDGFMPPHSLEQNKLLWFN